MGKASRDKGARNERAAVQWLQDRGFVAARVAGSGGFASRTTSPKMREALTGDVVIECDRGDLRIEVKARKSLPGYLLHGGGLLCDGVAVYPEGFTVARLRDYVNNGGAIRMAAWLMRQQYSGRPTPAYLRDWLAQSPDGIVMMREVRVGSTSPWVFAFTPEAVARLTSTDERTEGER